MVARTKDLWSLVLNQQWIDAEDLAQAVQREVVAGRLDFRTRLLVRDAVRALENYWGHERSGRWLAESPVRENIERILREDLGRPGFPYLKEQVMESIHPETVREFLRELSGLVHKPVRLCIGGSIALILPGYLSRPTQDLDVVDEVPAEIRSQRDKIEDLQRRYRIELAHFQQHYLPSRWEDRLHYFDTFGPMRVYLVDLYDVFLSKLFSGREKDRDDLRALLGNIDKEVLIRKLKDTTQSMLVAPGLREKAEKNWYILYGEPLPA